MSRWGSAAVLLAAAASVTDAATPAWRGVHVLDAGASSLPALRRLIAESLAPCGANVLVYEVDYNFAFRSHPGLAGEDAWTRETAAELAGACAAAGIRLIPQINCLGHQSWKAPPGALLRARPDFEEPPDARTPRRDPASKDFYCRSWCPRHPEVYGFVGDLMDELLDAFQADHFHCGMDEVFVIASDRCSRCRGADPAVLFAEAVNALHARLKRRGATMLIWGDRLLDGAATGYGEWEASLDGTHRALGMIPKDVIVCDWHYEARDAYPSLRIFSEAGFRVWPAVWRNADGARAFLAAARAAKDPKVLGVLATVWDTGAALAGALLGKPPVSEGARASLAEVSKTLLDTLEGARDWTR